MDEIKDLLNDNIALLKSINDKEAMKYINIILKDIAEEQSNKS